MDSHLILARHSSHLRQVSEQDVVASLDDEAQRKERVHLHVDTTAFKDSIDQGDWSGQDSYLLNASSQIAAAAGKFQNPELHYFGLAEIPHVIALGAYVGDERIIHLHEYNRGVGDWRWPAPAKTLSVESTGLPEGKPVMARGSVVVRVVISVPVSDADISEAVGTEHLAEVTVGLAGGAVPTYGNVQSQADLEAIRLEFRQALAAVRKARPNTDTIHLFVGAGSSVCFALGQELKLRNSPPVQTYRFRKVAGEPSYKPALLLGRESGAAEVALSPAQVARAKEIRTTDFTEALGDVITYAANRKDDFGTDGPWYHDLAPKDTLRAVKPFPALRPLAAIYSSMRLERDKVDPEPFVGSDGYGYDKDRHLWRLADTLLLGLDRAADGDRQRLRQLIRLFLFHEYLHDYHSLSKYTADEVGKFNNSLEHLDYTADTYALLHQLDLSQRSLRELATSDDKKKEFLADQIELAIRSFWAFDVDGTVEWQVRRIRRYLNWYWRHVQVTRATDLRTAMLLFPRQPRLEIGGLKLIARDRRVWARLGELDRTTHLELAVVTEDDRLVRLQESADLSIRALLDAFHRGAASHTEIIRFFNSVFEHVNERGDGAALPGKVEHGVTYGS